MPIKNGGHQARRFSCQHNLVQTHRHTGAVLDSLLNHVLIDIRLAGNCLHRLSQGDRHDLAAWNCASVVDSGLCTSM